MKTFCLAAALAAAACAADAAGFTALDRDTARRLGDPASHREPTVVALWSMECVYCKKNLKLLGALSRRAKPLKVITVAAEAELPASAAILDGHGVRGARYAYGADAPEALAYALDPTWQGELPRTLVFDGRGGKTALSGGLDEARVRQLLQAVTPRP